jgi:hypothetical protein
MAGTTTRESQRGISGLAQRANPAFATGAVAVPILALVGAIASGNTQALVYVHVMAGVLWTGTDLFMGAVLGPVVGGLDPEERGSFFARFTPKMTFLMPVLAMVTITAGIKMGLDRGFPHFMPWLALMTAATTIPIVLLIGVQFDALTAPKTLVALAVAVVGSGLLLVTTLPDFGMASPWVIATLAIVTLLTIFGFGVILPGEVRIYRQLTSGDPDYEIIGQIGMRNAKLGGLQGALQLSIIFLMVGLRYGYGLTV